MRPRALKQTFLAITQIIAIAVCLSAPSLAQTPTPSTSPAPTTGAGGMTFSENLSKITERAIQLVSAIQSAFEDPVLSRLERISQTLALLIMIVAFAKMWRENGGAGTDLFWWFARLGVIFALLGSGPKIINGMAETGQRIAGNQNSITNTYIMYETQRSNFDANYKMFNDKLFTVRGEKVPREAGGVVGVLSSDEFSTMTPIEKVEYLSTNMSFLLTTMNISRSVLSFGDLFLTVLGGFLMIAMRLAAPVMIALAIDRSLAQQASYPYLWGVIVLTLIWPLLTLFIKIVAYLGGNIGLVMNDKQQMYQFSDETMQILKSGDQQPVFTICFAAVVMLIAGLALWTTPYIAYQLISGKVYDAVSTMASTVGSGIQYAGASLLARSLSPNAIAARAAGGGAANLNQDPLNRMNYINGGIVPNLMRGPRQNSFIPNAAASKTDAPNYQPGQVNLDVMRRNIERNLDPMGLRR